MKRREFIRQLIDGGCFLYCRGSKHDLNLNPEAGKKAPVPRHREIKNSLCTLIRNQLYCRLKIGDIKARFTQKDSSYALCCLPVSKPVTRNL